MADMTAVDRAASAPAPGLGATSPGLGAPGLGSPGSAPGLGAPEGGGIEQLAQSVESIGAFLQAQAGQGNPAAQEAMMAFQSLIQAMSRMGGEPAPRPEEAIQEQQPMGTPPGATVM